MSNFDENTVYILDSYGLIYRCYFAFINRPLTNSNGENISALFGFFRNLHSVLTHYKPNYLFAAMDSKTKTFRHNFYPEYKATRNKTPDDLHAQIPWISQVLNAMGVPILQCDGYEADDIIATVAKKCTEQNKTCRILSGDKDLMQLVSENVQILKPDVAATWKVTDSDAVQAEWGVKPAQLLDLLSLCGDTADNIPGIKGVGVKTAAKLLSEYNSLDGIYQNIEELKGSTKQKLVQGKESAYFSQKLVRLNSDVPCSEIDLALSKKNTFNFLSSSNLLKQFGSLQNAKQYAELSVNNGENLSFDSEAQITSVATFFGTDTPQCPVTQNKGNYKAITDVKELKNYITDAINAKTVSFSCEKDLENTLDCNIQGFSLCFQKQNAVYVPLGEISLFDTEKMDKNTAFCELHRLFDNKDVNIIMHNAKLSLKVLASNGFFTNQIEYNCSITDTMISFWLLNPEQNGKNYYSLENLSETYLRLKGLDFKQIIGKDLKITDIPLEQLVLYSAEKADFTLGLWLLLKEKFNDDTNKNLLNMEMQVLPILANMEFSGIHLDSKALNEYNTELKNGINNIENKIYNEVGHAFNIASPKQLQTVLFTERHLTPEKKTKTGYSTDTSVLEELARYDEVPKMILEYRELSKLKSTYVETLPKMTDKNGRIHTDFVQTGTATGRLSCRDPNLQNIPIRSEAGRRIRSAFCAPNGKVLISADYAQIELVVLAHLSGDKNMCNAFINGVDVHKATAALIFGVKPEDVTDEMRRTAKTINFGVIYGMSAFRLANDLEISRTQASEFIANYDRLYSGITNFKTETISKAETTGYAETIFGRRRPILNINSKNKIEKAAAERVAINTPVQGSAADIVKKAMILVSDSLKKANNGAKLLLQVHDELILECPDNKEVINQTILLVKQQMENAVKLSVPLRVSIESGKNWGIFH